MAAKPSGLAAREAAVSKLGNNSNLDLPFAMFSQKRGPDSKRLFLRTFSFYFMLAWFTHRSPLPKVDNACCEYSDWNTSVLTAKFKDVSLVG